MISSNGCGKGRRFGGGLESAISGQYPVLSEPRLAVWRCYRPAPGGEFGRVAGGWEIEVLLPERGSRRQLSCFGGSVVLPVDPVGGPHMSTSPMRVLVGSSSLARSGRRR